MPSISLPNTTFNLTAAPRPTENAPQRILLIGQQVSGTSNADILVKNIGTSGEEDALFGRRSMLATMVRAFRRFNPLSQIDAIPLDDAIGSLKAQATVTFSDAPTEDGALVFYIQSKELFKFEIPVFETDTPTSIAIKFFELIDSNTSILVDASALGGEDIILFSHGGTVGNDLTLEFDESTLVPGLTVDLTSFVGGSIDPDISSIFAQLDQIRYQTVVYPGEYDNDEIKNFLAPRFNPTNAVKDGVSITSLTDTEANLISLADQLDSHDMTIFGNKPVDDTFFKGSSLFEFNPTIASYIAAIRTLRLTSDANIVSLLVGPSGSTFGGPWLAAVPYHNTPVSNLAVIDSTKGWTSSEQNTLNNSGISFLGDNVAFNEIIFGDVVTTYLNNAQGIPDTSFKFLNTIDTGSQIREYFYTNNKLQYAQATLTSGDMVPFVKMVDIPSFNAFQQILYKQLSVFPYALTVAGSAALRFFATNIVSVANFQTGFITTTMIVPIVSQLRGINGTLEISFDIPVGG